MHCHALIHDQKTAGKLCTLSTSLASYDPVSALNDDSTSKFSVSNSSLSEFGVLGFELRYSMVRQPCVHSPEHESERMGLV